MDSAAAHPRVRAFVPGAVPWAAAWVRRAAVWFGLAAVLLELALSANLLTVLGTHYVTDGGTLPEKLHPGSYCAFAAAGCALAGRWLAGERVRHLLWRQRWLLLFLLCTGFCVLMAAAFTGASNEIVLFDNFLPAGCLGLALAEVGDADRTRLRRLLMAGIFANALLGVGEALAGAHMLPLYLNGVPASERAEDFRPIALYDHPLTGATVTLIGLFLPGLRRASWVRPPGLLRQSTYLFVLAAGLVAFGGRAAAAVAVMAAGWCGGVRLWRRLGAGRLSPAALAGLAAAGLACVALTGLALAAGGGGRIAHHGIWDPSAASRLMQWRILGALNGRQVLFGATRPALLDDLEMLRLDSGIDVIENFALLMFATLGIAGFAVFAVGFVAWVRWAWAFDGRRGRVMVLCFLLAISASNSLGRKSTLLLIMTAAIVSQSVTARAGARPA